MTPVEGGTSTSKMTGSLMKMNALTNGCPPDLGHDAAQDLQVVGPAHSNSIQTVFSEVKKMYIEYTNEVSISELHQRRMYFFCMVEQLI